MLTELVPAGARHRRLTAELGADLPRRTRPRDPSRRATRRVAVELVAELRRLDHRIATGEIVRHRLSHAGDRALNHALHMMALTQIQGRTARRAYYQRKRSEGKSHKEAMRCLKRRLSDVIYRRLRADAAAITAGPGGHPRAAA